MRVVSLVPSLTETFLEMADASQGGLLRLQLCGRTTFCIHPKERLPHVPVMGGTKTPKLEAILRAEPDLVLLDEEENPRAIYDQLLMAGIPVVVSRITAATQVPNLYRSLGERLGLPAEAEALAAQTESALAATRRSDKDSITVAPLIWHKPLMGLAEERYGGSLLAHVGFRVAAFESSNGYPTLSYESLGHAHLDALLLSSEPHDFTQEEGTAIANAVEDLCGRRPLTVKIDGEMLTWFGTRTAAALHYFHALRASLLLAMPPRRRD